MMNRIESFRSIGSRIPTVCKSIDRQPFSRMLFLLFCCKLAFSRFNSGFTAVVRGAAAAADSLPGLGRSEMRKFAAAAMALVLLPSMSSAQAVGSISGTITDSTGAVMAHVQVNVKNQGTGEERTVTTDDSGHYMVPLLPVGTYSVTASANGFRSSEDRNVNLEVQQNRTIDLVLQPASVGTEITVSSQEAQVEVQRTDATLGQTIHSEQVAQLPLNGRDFVQLALLGPGTVRGQRPGDFLNQGGSSEVSFRGSVSLSAQGMRENANDWLYDGVDDNELTAGGVGFLPQIDAIREFRVLTFNYSAEYGSRGGTTVLVSSKSGTNELHGTLFEFVRNQIFGARKAKYNQNEFGGSLGGPVWKNKTFFFTDFQVNKIRQGLTILSTVPTALERQGIFTESFPNAPLQTIYDPNSLHTDPTTGAQVRNAFIGNQIPASEISPIGLAIANLYPLPIFTDRLGGNYLSNPVKTIDDGQWDFRIDHTFRDQDHLFARFSWDDASEFLPSGLPGFGAASAFSSTQSFTTHARNVALSETHILSPTLINQVTVGYNRDFNYIQSYGYGSNESARLGIHGANLGTPETSEMTQISITGYNPVGDRQFSPFQGGTDIYEAKDALDWSHGNHSLHFGFMYRAMQENTLGDNAFAGAFTFNNLFTAAINPNGSLNGSTGNAIASLLIGYPTSGSRNNELNGSTRGRRWKEYRGFLQDDWTVNKKLTLNFGVAYDVTTPEYEAHNRFSNLIFKTGQILIAGQNAGPTVGVNTDYSGVEPRFGFAWTPFSSNTVLRGGYGIFHDTSAQGGTTGPYQNPPYANAYAFTSNNITPVRTLATGFPDNSQPIDPATAYHGDWHVFDPSYKMGRIQQWNFNIQQALPGSTVLTLAYAGTYGNRLMEKNFNFNSAPPGPYNNPAALRPYPQYNSILVTDSHGWLNYQSLQVKAERRAVKGLYMLASYTYSKALTNGLVQEITSGPGQDYYPLLPFPSADKGLASTDLRQNFTLSYLYQLPFGKGQTYLSGTNALEQAVLGNWQINGITIIHTGFPLGMTMASNQSGTGIGNRPNRVCDGSLSNPSVFEWFNTACFVAPVPGTLGNAARTELYGPGQVNFDFSVFKNFPVTEHREFQFRSEFFNILNHPQFSVPGTALGSATFGQIQSTVNSPRQIQFALKYVF